MLVAKLAVAIYFRIVTTVGMCHFSGNNINSVRFRVAVRGKTCVMLPLHNGVAVHEP